MKIFAFVVFLIITVLIVCGINSLVIKLAYSKDKRYLQFRMIISTFLFGLVFSNNLVGSLLISLVGNFFNLPTINKITSTIFPMRFIELLFLLLCTIGVNLVYAVVYLVHLLIERITIFKDNSKFDVYWDYDLCVGSEKIKHWPWLFVNKFYNENSGKIKLSHQGYSLGVFVKWMKFASVIVWGAELIVIALSIILNVNILSGIVLNLTKKFYLLPMVSFFLFEQIQLFFEGPMGSPKKSVSSEDINEEMIGDVEALLPCYKECFKNSEAILCSEIGPKHEIKLHDVAGVGPGTTKKFDCNEPDELDIVINQLKQSGIKIKPNFENTIIQLINGNSVFIKDNVIGEFTPYYCSFLNMYISLGKKVLILCTDEEMVRKVEDSLYQFSRMSYGNNMLWEICNVSNYLKNKDNANVLIITYNDFISLDTKITYKTIADNTFFTVFPDCIGLIEENYIVIELLLSKLQSFRHPNRYIFISSVDNLNVRSNIEQLFFYDKIGLAVSENDSRKAHASAMVWKGEAFYKLQEELGIGRSMSPYLGVALPLALIALKNDFPKVYIIKSNRIGDDFFINASMSSNSGDIIQYFNSQFEVASRVRTVEAEAIIEDDMKIICIYDEDFNFFNALWKWFKYGGKKSTLIHVISPFYMLREYFADNYKNIISSHNEHMALISNQSVLDTVRKQSLLALFVDCDISEEEVWDIADQYKWDYVNIQSLLLDALRCVLPENEVHNFSNHFKFIDDYRFDTNNEEVQRVVYVRLTDENIKRALKAKVEPARISFGDNNVQALGVLKGNIYNYCLTGQIITYCGEYYLVNQIGDGIIYANLNSPVRVYDYFTISDFSILDSVERFGFDNKNKLEIQLLQSTVVRRIFGYVSSVKGNDFSSASSFRNVVSFPEPIKVGFDMVPVMEIRIRRNFFRKDAEKAIYLLSVLFNGAFKTLFPYSYQNITAVADIAFDEKLCNRIIKSEIDYSVEDLAKTTIPGISSSDRDAADDYVRLYIIEHSCVEYGMINSLYQSMDMVLNCIYGYLNWYLAGGKGKYLNFGSDSILKCFASEELLLMLKTILMNYDEPLIGNDDHIDFGNKSLSEHGYTCTFCGRRSYFAWKFKDNRILCGHCHEHILSQEDEITQVFKETVEYMSTFYNVTVSENINVRFQSKDAIERVAGKVIGGRTVGFFTPVSSTNNDGELWIERKGPAVTMQSTMAHELTHAWQFAEIDIDALLKCLGKNANQKLKLLQEGHAVFVQIDYMRRVYETDFADVLEKEYSSRTDDVYGIGYELFKQFYEKEIENDSTLNPFDVMVNLVNSIINGEEPIEWPSNISKL